MVFDKKACDSRYNLSRKEWIFTLLVSGFPVFARASLVLWQDPCPAQQNNYSPEKNIFQRLPKSREVSGIRMSGMDFLKKLISRGYFITDLRDEQDSNRKLSIRKYTNLYDLPNCFLFFC